MISRVEQTRFMFFSALLIITQTLPVHAIRNQKHNNPILSLPLHPRVSFSYNPSTNNHTARTMSMMEADAARVKYLNSRLKNALFKSGSGLEAENIQSPLTAVGGGAGYVARIGVGQPATETTLLADTGSEIVWVKCSDSVYDPSKSSSFQTLPCTSPQCSADCSDDGTCPFRASYGDGSVTEGDFITETLSFGSSESVPNVAIGCGRDVTGENQQLYDGILGLGPDPISLPNQLKATSFSYCLVDSSSESASATLDFNSVAPSDSITVGMVRNSVADVYYYVELTGITVGQDQVSVPPEVYQIGSDGRGGVIIDSGTTITMLKPQVYNSLLETFQNNAQNLAPENHEGNDACYSFSAGESLPMMSFQFSNGESLDLAPKNYFRQVGESTYCFAFQPTDQIVSIIGNVAQKGMRITYDLGNNQIGFSPNKC